MLPIDPRVWLRAFDDLHTLAVAATAALDDLHTVAVVAQELHDIETRLTERLDTAQRTLEEAVTLANRLLVFDDRAAEVLESVQVLNAAATTLAAAVEPLQGTAERLGRIADRLPGGRRPAA